MDSCTRMLVLIACIACGHHVKLYGKEETPTKDREQRRIGAEISELYIAPLRIIEPNGTITTFHFPTNSTEKTRRVVEQPAPAARPNGETQIDGDQEDPNVRQLRETELLQQHVLDEERRIRTIVAERHSKLYDEAIRKINALKIMKMGVI